MLELLLGNDRPKEVRALLERARIRFGKDGSVLFPSERPEMTRALPNMAAVIASTIHEKELREGFSERIECVVGGRVIPTNESAMEGVSFSLAGLVASQLAFLRSNGNEWWRVDERYHDQVHRFLVARTERRYEGERHLWKYRGDRATLNVRSLIIVDRVDTDFHGDTVARVAKGVVSSRVHNQAIPPDEYPTWLAGVVAIHADGSTEGIAEVFRRRLGDFVPPLFCFWRTGENDAPHPETPSSGDLPRFTG